MDNPKQKTKSKNKGFSLVEVLLAICILGLIAAPILQMLYSSYAMNQKSKKYLAAADLLQTVMEGVSAQTWKDSKPVAEGTTAVEGLNTYYHTTLVSGESTKSKVFNPHGTGGNVKIPEGYFNLHSANSVNGRIIEPIQFSDVECDNGYTFQVYIYIDVTNLATDQSKNYFTVPLKVTIMDEDGTEIKSASTSIISERTKL